MRRVAFVVMQSILKRCRRLARISPLIRPFPGCVEDVAYLLSGRSASISAFVAHLPDLADEGKTLDRAPHSGQIFALVQGCQPLRNLVGRMQPWPVTEPQFPERQVTALRADLEQHALPLPDWRVFAIVGRRESRPNVAVRRFSLEGLRLCSQGKVEHTRIPAPRVVLLQVPGTARAAAARRDASA